MDSWCIYFFVMVMVASSDEWILQESNVCADTTLPEAEGGMFSSSISGTVGAVKLVLQNSVTTCRTTQWNCCLLGPRNFGILLMNNTDSSLLLPLNYEDEESYDLAGFDGDSSEIILFGEMSVMQGEVFNLWYTDTWRLWLAVINIPFLRCTLCADVYFYKLGIPKWGYFTPARLQDQSDELSAESLFAFHSMILTAGHVLAQPTDNLTADYFAQIDVFFTSRLASDSELRGMLSNAEIEALADWINLDGGKLVVTAPGGGTHTETYRQITAPFGIGANGYFGVINRPVVKTSDEILSQGIQYLIISKGCFLSKEDGNSTVLFEMHRSVQHSLPVVIVREKIGARHGAVLVIGDWDSLTGDLGQSTISFLSNVIVWAEGYCGDGVPKRPEQCDDGNSIDDDDCTNACTIPRCGDGVIQVNAGEACDDGNDLDDDLCRNDCTAPICGDGIVDVGEECDDGIGNMEKEFCGRVCTKDCRTTACNGGFCFGKYICGFTNWCFPNPPNCSNMSFDEGYEVPSTRLPCECTPYINVDLCDSPYKFRPGVCGCDQRDIDSDRDGVLDCLDACPQDPSKQAGPCGVVDCGDCSVANGSPGCSVESVESCVCFHDPICCILNWDDLCAAHVVSCGC